MKFRRQERYSYHWTPAKEAAYLRKPQRVQNKLDARYPLIADQLTTPQSTLEGGLKANGTKTYVKNVIY